MNTEQFKQDMERIMKNYHVPGGECVIYQNHNEIFRHRTGFRDIENNIKIDGNELYLIFSMTKMVTCVCALQLLEQSKYSLDDPVYKYIPEYKEMQISIDSFANSKDEITTGGSIGETVNLKNDRLATTPITIRHLFTMAGGLNYDLKADYIKDAIANGKTSTIDIAKALSKTVLAFEPGTHFQYSLCHDILGALVEIWSGMSLGEYMEENLFKPLDMKDTFFGIPNDEERLSRMAPRYNLDENHNWHKLPLECCYNLTPQYQSGGAGLTSSSNDYILFLDALANGGMGKSGNRILSPTTVELFRTNQMKGQQSEDFYDIRKGYGFGLGVRTHLYPEQSGSLSPIGEFGWDGAAGGLSMVDPKNKIALVYLQEMHNWDLKMHVDLRNAFYKSIKFAE